MDLRLDHVFRLREDNVKNTLLTLLSLPLLPANRIEDTYDTLGMEINPEVFEEIEGFISNFGDEWMEKVKPSKFSCFGNFYSITDALQTYSSWIHTKLSRNNDNIWLFTSKYFIGRL